MRAAGRDRRRSLPVLAMLPALPVCRMPTVDLRVRLGPAEYRGGGGGQCAPAPSSAYTQACSQKGNFTCFIRVQGISVSFTLPNIF